jgi:hypothetical protein
VVSGHGTTFQPPGPAICYHTLWRARRLCFPVPEVQRRSPPESGQRYDAAFFEGEMWMVSLKQASVFHLAGQPRNSALDWQLRLSPEWRAALILHSQGLLKLLTF